MTPMMIRSRTTNAKKQRIKTRNKRNQTQRLSPNRSLSLYHSLNIPPLNIHTPTFTRTHTHKNAFCSNRLPTVCLVKNNLINRLKITASAQNLFHRQAVRRGWRWGVATTLRAGSYIHTIYTPRIDTTTLYCCTTQQAQKRAEREGTVVSTINSVPLCFRKID